MRTGRYGNLLGLEKSICGELPDWATVRMKTSHLSPGGLSKHVTGRPQLNEIAAGYVNAKNYWNRTRKEASNHVLCGVYVAAKIEQKSPHG